HTYIFFDSSNFDSESVKQYSYFYRQHKISFDAINRNPDILPNVTLGFQAYDSCDFLQYDLKGALQVLTGYDGVIPNYRCTPDVPLSSIIGPAISTHSILIAHILGLYGLAHLVLHFGWTWVGLLAADNDYGQQGIQLVQQEIVNGGACVAFTENILMSQPNRNAPHIVNVMKASTAVAVVVYSTDVDVIPILEEMLLQNVTGKIFIASEAWSTTTVATIDRYNTLLSGTLGLALHSGTILGLIEYLNKIDPSMELGRDWIKIFWELAFNCNFISDKNETGSLDTNVNKCTGTEDLESIQNIYNDVSSLRTAFSVYTAVHVVVNALEAMNNCKKGEESYSCPDIYNFMPWQVILTRRSYYMFFDKNGDPPATYDIVNWQLSPSSAMKYVKVGSYDTADPHGNVFTINISAITWTSGNQKVPVSVCSQSCPPGFWKATKKGEPVCCFQCVPCPQGEISNHTDSYNCLKCPWNLWPNPDKSRCLPKLIEYLSYEDSLGKTMASTSTVSSLVPIAILKIFIQFKATPIVKANNYSLSCLLLVSLSFCFLCSLAFIGYPQLEKCLIRQVAFGMVFALCISCILAKTMMVIFAFMVTKPGSNLKKWTNPWVSYMIVFISSLIQFLLCLTWLSLSPPFPEENMETQPTIIILHCNEGSRTAFWCMLGYLGLLATVSFIFAFLARRLPDSFNEAKFITFSMLAFLSVWVSYIPASLSAQGKYTVAMEIFAILTSTWALVICMFVPKCFIILFRPNMNSRH
uniref:G-protein coupled receptors family 3 profile domain-containing protein n=1 Tax=Leptobrachium leishanense TaxID=445787 RepID=A0A8C5MUK1_9ANUR